MRDDTLDGRLTWATHLREQLSECGFHQPRRSRLFFFSAYEGKGERLLKVIRKSANARRVGTAEKVFVSGSIVFSPAMPD
jgi:hypothetical protein